MHLVLINWRHLLVYGVHFPKVIRRDEGEEEEAIERYRLRAICGIFTIENTLTPTSKTVAISTTFSPLSGHFTNSLSVICLV